MGNSANQKNDLGRKQGPLAPEGGGRRPGMGTDGLGRQQQEGGGRALSGNPLQKFEHQGEEKCSKPVDKDMIALCPFLFFKRLEALNKFK